jgi:hypothetical protein
MTNLEFMDQIPVAYSNVAPPYKTSHVLGCWYMLVKVRYCSQESEATLLCASLVVQVCVFEVQNQTAKGGSVNVCTTSGYKQKCEALNRHAMTRYKRPPMHCEHAEPNSET